MIEVLLWIAGIVVFGIMFILAVIGGWVVFELARASTAEKRSMGIERV